MIKLQNLTPEVYYKQSRDFQYIGRLYDLVMNSVKTNADMIYDIPSSDAAGSKMIDLLALTLGFKAKHNYNVKQLAAICSIFPIILKNKGNLKAIQLICDAILHAEGITEEALVVISDTDIYTIQIFVSAQLNDITLLNDLLDYVLPAGMLFDIVKSGYYTATNAKTTSTESSSLVDIQNPINSNELSTIVTPPTTPYSGLELTPENSNGLYNAVPVPGFIINSTVYKPEDDSSDDEGE